MRQNYGSMHRVQLLTDIVNKRCCNVTKFEEGSLFTDSIQILTNNFHLYECGLSLPYNGMEIMALECGTGIEHWLGFPTLRYLLLKHLSHV